MLCGRYPPGLRELGDDTEERDRLMLRRSWHLDKGLINVMAVRIRLGEG